MCSGLELLKKSHIYVYVCVEILIDMPTGLV